MKIYLRKTRPSNGGVALIRALGGKVIKKKNSRYKGGKGKYVINWGCSEPFEDNNILNKPELVAVAANKLSTFKALDLAGLSNLIPEFTTSHAVAKGWVEEGSTVVCRKTLTGSGGAGIVIAESIEQLVEAPLYTMYKPKKEEYRIHVMGNKIIFKQRKAMRKGLNREEVNFKVRNLEGGFIYAHKEDRQIPEKVLSAALECHKALKLDFGAYDIVYNERGDKAFFLEVNTAPGLTGTTLEVYAKEMANLLRDKERGWQELDTRKLQLLSVLRFASALGVSINIDLKVGGSTSWVGVKSFQEICMLHNGNVSFGDRGRLQFMYARAAGKKVVEKVYLQKHKRPAKLGAVQHQVKMVNGHNFERAMGSSDEIGEYFKGLLWGAK